MRILVTNDDGIHGPGLVTLERIAAQFTDEVWTVAPETDQSGSAHSLTLSDPLRLREVGERRYALRGTPTDCVIMAVRNVMPSPPDLILSGVNRGQNVADDVGYSGTVAGAMEGTVLGFRSIALSQAIGPESRRNPHYATAEAKAPAIISALISEKWPPGILYNLNFPALPPEAVGGVEVTVQGKRDQDFLAIDPRIDGRGVPYYWIAYSASRFETPPGTDIRAVAEGRISVTPLRLDLTAHELLGSLADRLGAVPSVR